MIVYASGQRNIAVRDLAERMARLARLLHDLIRQAFAKEGATGDLHSQYTAFQKVLISDLSVDQFADMYAQTIAYERVQEEPRVEEGRSGKMALGRLR